MVKITDRAQAKITHTLRGDGFLMVSVLGGGCSGYRIDLSPMIEIPPDSIEIGSEVFTDTTSAGYLKDATLDFDEDPFQPSFKFEIPNTHSCGCGSSFQFDEANND